jgi:glutathione S-transferase
MLTVWGRISSSNVQAVMWCIHELELPVTRIDAGLHYGVTDTTEYLSMNPNGTVPTLQDGNNAPLWESAAILRYLASTYATDSFWPSDALLRANVDRWAEWSKVSVAMNFTSPIFWRVARTPRARRDPGAIAEAAAHLEKFLAIADAQLSKNTYLAGDYLTLADIQLGHILYRYYDIELVRADLKNLRRYYDMLTERPAYKTNVMVSYEELIDTK